LARTRSTVTGDSSRFSPELRARHDDFLAELLIQLRSASMEVTCPATTVTERVLSW
jgi:hypothetical protein